MNRKLTAIPPGAILFGALLGFQLWFGILPAWRAVGSDFPNYYTSSRMLVQREDISNVYDDTWFQQRIFREGIDAQGKFSPFPPTTMLLMAPLTSFPPLTALRIWTMVNILLVPVLAWQIVRLTGKSLLFSLNMVLISGLGLANNFRLGQVYLLVAVAIGAGFLALKNAKTDRHDSEREFTSGFLAGLAGAIKYIPMLLVIPYFRYRRWSALIGTIMGFVALVGLTMVMTGMKVWRIFFTNIFFGHLGGLIQNPYAPQFQSINALFRTLFVVDPLFNPTPLIDAPILMVISAGMVYCATVMMLVTLWMKSKRQDEVFPLEFAALIFIAFLTILPASATYHFLLLTLPISILVTASSSRIEGAPWKHNSVLIMYGLMGFLPYQIFRTFYLHASSIIGPFAVICAYPRLFLMIGIYLASFSLVLSRMTDGRRSQ